MSTKHPAKANQTSSEMEQAADQVIKLLMSGGTIGQYLGHTQESMEGLYSLGYSLYKQGKYAEAEKTFGALLVCHHIDRRVYQAYAACLQMQQRYEEAIRYHLMSAAMDFTDPAPAFYTAECLLAMGKRAEAINSLRHVIALPKRSPEDQALTERALGMLDLMGVPVNAMQTEAAQVTSASPHQP